MFRTQIAAAAAALFLSLASTEQAQSLRAFDVAEDHTRIFTSAAPLHENGMPAHRNAFISQGYIYPAGTLDAGTTGVLEDGSPAFPDLVLGTWTCDGYFVGAGGKSKTGVWVTSRQIFVFKAGDMIVTQGTEIVGTGVENLRPITGATGDYASFGGGLFQTLLGFNKHMAINATFRFPDRNIKRAPSSPEKGRSKEMVEQPSSDIEWDSGVPVGPYPESRDPSHREQRQTAGSRAVSSRTLLNGYAKQPATRRDFGHQIVRTPDEYSFRFKDSQGCGVGRC